jgi:hypothetical protein
MNHRVLQFPLSLALLVCTLGCKPPEKPAISPAGDVVTVAPGQSEIFSVATADADVSYKWSLQGEGQISRTTGTSVVFTAPRKDGAMALLTVAAQNKHGSSPEASVAISVPSTAFVPLEAAGISAGWMSGGGQPASFIHMERGAGNCRGQSPCSRFTYSPGGQWGGIFWWPRSCGTSGTPDAWNRFKRGLCGINVLDLGGFGTVSRFTFWVRGLKGGEVLELRVGSDDAKPVPGKSLPKVALSSQWQRYEIDLDGVDLTNAAALFLWTATDQDNPEGATFFLEDPRFEGFKRARSSR